ncbi:hypothetical protein Ancab_031283 [Ancistrocladus abbreviatus]
MAEQGHAFPPPEPLDIDFIRSRITELTNILTNPNDKSEFPCLDSEKLLHDYISDFENKVEQLLAGQSDISSLKDEDLDAYSEHLREELRMTEDETANICNEIEVLRKTCMEGTLQLERDLEGLNCMLDYVKSQGLGEVKEVSSVASSKPTEDHTVLSQADCDRNFQMLNLKHQIKEKKAVLKSLQDLDSLFKRLEAIEKIEEAFTGLKVIEFEGNFIRLLLRTYIPNIEGFICPQKPEDIIEASEMNHELLVEVMDGSLELKNTEIFPNDVYIADIVEAATSFRQVSSASALLDLRSSLEWFLQKVQDRIVICTLRRYMLKNVGKSRHSLEYLDRDELIVAHLVGGIDAFIKTCQGWPLSTSALKLVSLKSSRQNMKEISLSMLCKVEEVANSLDYNVRRNIKDFVDAVEEILVERMREELHSDISSNQMQWPPEACIE